MWVTDWECGSLVTNYPRAPANAKLRRIMRIMEINIWLLETLFVLSIQIFEGQYFLYEGRKLIAFICPYNV